MIGFTIYLWCSLESFQILNFKFLSLVEESEIIMNIIALNKGLLQPRFKVVGFWEDNSYQEWNSLYNRDDITEMMNIFVQFV